MKPLFALFSLLALILFQPIAANAQSWPQHENTYINDYAGLLDEAAEADLRSQLEALRNEKGVEFTILTLADRKPFQTGGTYEDFSIGLFNEWGIGKSGTNDGILLLVLKDSREMSIELGSGYANDKNAIAGEIIDNVLTPAFRDGAFDKGIADGAKAIMQRIAEFEPPVKPAPAMPRMSDTNGGPDEGNKSGSWILKILGALLVGGIGWGIFGRRVKDSVSRCPSCNKRGIHTEKKVLEAATQTAEGRGETVVTCAHCGYVAATAFTIPMLRDRDDADEKADDDNFGGGSSSGGGASGTW